MKLHPLLLPTLVIFVLSIAPFYLMANHVGEDEFQKTGWSAGLVFLGGICKILADMYTKNRSQ